MGKINEEADQIPPVTEPAASAATPVIEPAAGEPAKAGEVITSGLTAKLTITVDVPLKTAREIWALAGLKV